MKILVGFLAIALAVVTWAYFEKPLYSFTKGPPIKTFIDGNPVGFRLKSKPDGQQTAPQAIAVSVEVPIGAASCLASACHLDGIYFINADKTCAAAASCTYPAVCPAPDTCLHVDATKNPVWIDSYQSDGPHDHPQEAIKGEVRIVLTK